MTDAAHPNRHPQDAVPSESSPHAVERPGLQTERTSLAWERTGISMMVAGLLLARAAAIEEVVPLAAVGLVQVAFGGGLLVWAGRHYTDAVGDPVALAPVHPRTARTVGIATMAFTAAGMLTVVAHGLRALST